MSDPLSAYFEWIDRRENFTAAILLIVATAVVPAALIILGIAWMVGALTS